MSDRLQAAADSIERELICCDVFERLSAKAANVWTADERREYRRHQICYWGSAARSLVIAEMDTEPTGRPPHPDTMIGRG